jgi:hypothetical protein
MTMPERDDDEGDGSVNVSKVIDRIPGVLLAYAALYVIGMIVGLGAKIVFDVQLRRPGSRQVVGLVILVLLLWGAISVTHTPFTDVLLPLVWAGTGLLAGFGSREMHTIG